MRHAARKKKKPHKRKLIWVFLVCVILAVICIKLLSWAKTSIFLFKNWRTNIVFYTQPLTLISFPRDADERTIIVTLPESLYVAVPYGYGDYRLGSVWKLGVIEKKEQLLADTTGDLLGVKVSGWFTKPEIIDLDANSFLPASVKEAFLPWGKTETTVKTNLNFLDQFLLYLKLSGLRANMVKVYSLEKDASLIENKVLPDGSDATVVNEKFLHNFLEQKFEETDVRQEVITLSVFNYTKVPNVGQKFAQYLTNLGGKVINIGNAEGDIVACEVRTAEKNKNKIIITYLHKELGCSVLPSEENQKSDVVVNIGKQWGDRWQLSL